LGVWIGVIGIYISIHTLTRYRAVMEEEPSRRAERLVSCR
jgi:hypothetical protein